jgi:hypothetical protein
MKRTIFTLIFAVIFSSAILPAEAALNSSNTVLTSIAMPVGKTTASNDRQKKRKLKKKVRKAGRLFKLVKTGKKDQKKARKLKKNIRRIINIW